MRCSCAPTDGAKAWGGGALVVSRGPECQPQPRRVAPILTLSSPLSHLVRPACHFHLHSRFATWQLSPFPPGREAPEPELACCHLLLPLSP